MHDLPGIHFVLVGENVSHVAWSDEFPCTFIERSDAILEKIDTVGNMWNYPMFNGVMFDGKLLVECELRLDDIIETGNLLHTPKDSSDGACPMIVKSKVTGKWWIIGPRTIDTSYGKECIEGDA